MTRHILISLCGTSPAVVTETVFMLAKAGDPPDKVVVITTVTGEYCLKKELMDSGIWTSLKKNVQCEISFSLNHEHLRLLPDDDGNAADVTDSRSVDRAASFILDVLRQYTENSDVKITFSIAGGRKSMSAVSALCMSLLGRRGDRLCHILVNPPFDDPALIPKFYFPIQGQIHTDREGETFYSATARLELSYLPFVHCRYLIENELKRLPGDYSRMVALANSNAETAGVMPELELDPANQRIRIGMIELKLPLQEFLLYWMLAERCKSNKAFLLGKMELYEEFVDFVEYSRTKLPRKFYFSCADIRDRSQQATLYKRISDLTATLRKASVSEFFLPTPKRGVYGLDLTPGKIRYPSGRPADVRILGSEENS